MLCRGPFARPGRPAHEIAFGQRDKGAQPRLQRSGVFVQFLAVERVADFRAQGVPRAQAGGFQAERGARFQDFAPKRGRDFGRRHHFKTVLPGVAGAGDIDGPAEEFAADDAVFPQRGGQTLAGGGGKTSVNELRRFRALQCQRAEIGGEVLQIHVGAPGKGGQLLVQPGGVRADARGVDDEEEFLRLDLIDVEVVNRAAALVAHERVLALPGLQFADVIGQHAVEEFRRRAAAHHDFAHVRDVEQSGGGAHGVVLLQDAGVMERHFPAAEINQARAQFLVGGEKWGSLKHEIAMSSCCDYIRLSAAEGNGSIYVRTD